MATRKPTKASATAVSKALAAAGVPKSTQYKVRIGYHSTWGFRAENQTTRNPETGRYVPTGTVYVYWVSGNFVRLPGDAESERTNLGKVTEILSGLGFKVEPSYTASGYMKLTVTRPAV